MLWETPLARGAETLARKIQFSQHFPLLGKKDTVICFNSLWNKGRHQGNKGCSCPKMGGLGAWDQEKAIINTFFKLLLTRQKRFGHPILIPFEEDTHKFPSLMVSQPHWEGINKPAGLGPPQTTVRDKQGQPTMTNTPCGSHTESHQGWC